MSSRGPTKVDTVPLTSSTEVCDCLQLVFDDHDEISRKNCVRLVATRHLVIEGTGWLGVGSHSVNLRLKATSKERGSTA
jgi:hypothetical protein